MKEVKLTFLNSRLMRFIKPGKFPYNVLSLFLILLYSCSYQI